MAKLQFRESFTMALVSLWSNKLRSFLTLLGIIIGVLTIIAVVSVIQGLNNYVYTKMSFYGANDFSVQKFSMIGTSLKDFKEQMKRKDITLVERDLLRGQLPDLRARRRLDVDQPRPSSTAASPSRTPRSAA